MKPLWIALLAGALLALTATSGMAQYLAPAKSGTVNLTEGQVLLNGQKVETSITHYPDIKEGSVLLTEEGRAEVLLTPGVTLRLGDHAGFKMITNRLIDTRLELLGGSAVVEADAIAKDTSVTVVVNGAAVLLPKAGIYRFDFDPAQLKVFKGEAAVQTGPDTTLVGAGRLCALGGTKAAVEKFGTQDTDALDNWSHRRGELMSMANVASANSAGNSVIGSGSAFWSAFNGGFDMMPLGCAGYASPMMPGFGYIGSLWASPLQYAAYPQLSGLWAFNSFYGMFSYVPCNGMFNSPYGYQYFSPVQSHPPTTTATNPVRRPVHRPTLALASQADRRPMALAVNGLRSTNFSAGVRGASGFRGMVSTGGGSFYGGGYSGSVGTASSVGTTSGFSGGVSHSGGGVSGAVMTSGGSGGRR